MGQFKGAIKNFAEYVLSSQRKAVLVAMLASVVPFSAWLGIIIMVLVTLRKGPKEGLIVLLWSSLPSVVVGYLYQPPMMLLMNTIGVYWLTWVLAIILRTTGSWSRLLDALFWLSLLTIVVVHLLVGDVQHMWATVLIESYRKMNVLMQWSLSDKVIVEYAHAMALYFTGIQIAILSVGNLLNIVCARYLQALLYNPGGLKTELYQLSLAWWEVPVALFGVGLAMWLKWPIALDGLPVLALLFGLAGVSVVHCVVHRAHLSTAYLVGMYVLLLCLFRYTVIVLVVVAMFDSVYNVRLRMPGIRYIDKKEGDN